MTTTTMMLVGAAILVCSGHIAAGNPGGGDHNEHDSTERIVFTTLRPANLDIYLIDGPDSEPRRLTDDPTLDYNATFSPDGRWLVFTSERGANTDLYALDLENGGPPVRLTRHPGIDDAADIDPDGERIAFVSTRDGNADIFVMPFSPGDPGAEETATNLTQHPLGDFRPAFSPDGEKIAFSRHAGRAGPRETVVTALHIMNVDGSDARVVYEPEGFAVGDPVWSTDGRLYFHRFSMRDLASGPRWASEIWSVSSDGSDARRVASDEALSLFAPVVDADHRIHFHGVPPQPARSRPPLDQAVVYSVAADSSDRRREVASDRLTACQMPAAGPEGRIACHGAGPTDKLHTKSNGNPLSRPGAHGTVELPDRTVELVGMHGYFADFLPDGRITYAEWLPQSIQVDNWGLPPIVISQIDGSDRRVVLDAEAGLHAWATSACPQGDWIAFNAGPDFAPVDAPVDIWKVRTDGTGLTNLTDDPDANDAFPAWSSDCERIVFRSGRDGNKEIYLMDADGSNLRRLSDHPATDTAPHISPDGEWIVFSTARGRSTSDEADELVQVSRQGRGEGAGFRLWIQRIDGSKGRFLEPDLVDKPGRDMHPRFSPDGKWIVFVSSRSGINDEWVYTRAPQPYGELWAIPVAGGEAVRLTHDKWENGLPRWGVRQ